MNEQQMNTMRRRLNVTVVSFDPNAPTDTDRLVLLELGKLGYHAVVSQQQDLQQRLLDRARKLSWWGLWFGAASFDAAAEIKQLVAGIVGSDPEITALPDSNDRDLLLFMPPTVEQAQAYLEKARLQDMTIPPEELTQEQRLARLEAGMVGLVAQFSDTMAMLAQMTGGRVGRGPQGGGGIIH